MRVFASVLMIAAFLVLIAMPEKIHADSNSAGDDCSPVVFKASGAECDHSCGYKPPEGPVIDVTFCLPGYFCKPGYVRRYDGGPCIPQSECPPATNDQP